MDYQEAIQGYIEEVECLRAKEHADKMNTLMDFSLSISRDEFQRNHGMFQLRGASSLDFSKNLVFWTNEGGGGLTQSQVFIKFFQNQICLGKWAEK